MFWGGVVKDTKRDVSDFGFPGACIKRRRGNGRGTGKGGVSS